MKSYMVGIWNGANNLFWPVFYERFSFARRTTDNEK
jgi:hypothetical protein